MTVPSATTNTSSVLEPEPIPELRGNYILEVIRSIPHDATSFTQGLELHDGRLLESQGLRGESGRSWINAQTGEIETLVALEDDEVFAEGITIVDDRFIQLTWQAHRAIIGDLTDLGTSDETFSYSGEGWGLCFDGQWLVRSDGTNTLRFHDPSTFEVVRTVQVQTFEGEAIENLNELECVGNQILANVWGWDQIMVINQESGVIDAIIDARSLRPQGTPPDLDHALNGIAHDADTDTYYLTGKLWPTIFQVRLSKALEG